ncbi:MAG TPA: hypothetical protein VI653_22195 [Steroidobacteraceae bacterium]
MRGVIPNTRLDPGSWNQPIAKLKWVTDIPSWSFRLSVISTPLEIRKMALYQATPTAQSLSMMQQGINSLPETGGRLVRLARLKKWLTGSNDQKARCGATYGYRIRGTWPGRIPAGLAIEDRRVSNDSGQK